MSTNQPDFKSLIERFTPRNNTADYQKARTTDGTNESLIAYKSLMALSNHCDAVADQIAYAGDEGMSSRIREFSALIRNTANRKKNS
jgi:hypothetical protein